MKEVSIILVDTGSESNKFMMSDIGKRKDAYQLSDIYEIKNVLLRKLHRLHYSYKLCTKYNIPWKSIWNKFCVLDKIMLDETKEYFLIFINNAIHKIDISYLNKLLERKNVHGAILLLDAYCDFPVNIKKQINSIHFEKKYSFQKSDCKKYGFEYINTIYSRVEILEENYNTKEYDLFFVGADKGRIDKIYSIYKQAVNAGLTCNFTVIVEKKKKKIFEKKYQGINIVSKRLSYSEILQGIMKTKCILELCQAGQDGLTMRFYEAIFYNKKLITNNETASEHPMYNDKYMCILKEDMLINADFIKKNCVVDYNYNNEMSPVHFVERFVEETGYAYN